MKSAINDYLHKHHHPCIAHTINLSTKEILNQNDELSEILKKCRQIAGQLNTTQLKVKQDVTTRWNSTYFMLQRLNEIKISMTAVMSTLQKAPQMLYANEWLVIDDCIPLLKPLDVIRQSYRVKNMSHCPQLYHLFEDFNFRNFKKTWEL